jgi:transposase-like protein
MSPCRQCGRETWNSDVTLKRYLCDDCWYKFSYEYDDYLDEREEANADPGKSAQYRVR